MQSSKNLIFRTLSFLFLSLCILFYCLSTAYGEEAKNNKVRIEYKYVLDSELSKDELSHLENGFPDIKASKDATYLLVYKGEGGKGIAYSTTPKTGDISSKAIYLVLALTAAGLGFKFRKRKNACMALFLSFAMIGTVGLSTKALAYENSALKNFTKIEEVQIGEKLFKNLNNPDNIEFLGVIDAEKLKSSADSPSDNSGADDKKPDAPKPPITPDKSDVPKDDVYPITSPDVLKSLDKNQLYEDGVYFGQGEGRTVLKPVKVKVTVEKGRITKVEKQNPNEMVDDGGAYETIGFNHMIDEIIANQNPQTINKQMSDLFNICKLVYNQANSFNSKKADFESAFNKYIPGINPDSSFDNMKHDQVVDVVKKKLMNLGYDKVDAVTGATYTGKGTAAAIVNALEKANKNVTLSDFTVMNIKTNYKEGGTFELSNLKIQVTLKNGEQREIPYNDFDKNGFKVVMTNTGNPITSDILLTEEGLGFSISRGLHMQVVHIQTNTVKNVPTILIAPDVIDLQPKNVLVRAAGATEWIEAKVFTSNTFNQKIDLSKEQKAALSGKALEFVLIATDEKNIEHRIALTATGSQELIGTDKEKEYYLSISKDAISAIGKKYVLKFYNWNITLSGLENPKDKPIDNNDDKPVSTLTPYKLFVRDKDSNISQPLELVGDFNEEDKVFRFKDKGLANALKGKELEFEVKYKDEQGKEYSFTLVDAFFSVNDEDVENFRYSGEEFQVNGSVYNNDSSLYLEEEAFDFKIESIN